MYVFFFSILLVPVITHKSHVMSAHPCLQVHDCISACPCFLSCMFACPCAFLHVTVCLAAFCWHVHVSMAASLHGVHACMFMSACLQVCVSMSRSMPDFFTILLVPVITHKSQACLHIHVCMSVNACLHVHVCLAACLHVHLDFFLRFCSCHTPQVPGHVCISLSACPYMHFCMSMFS